MSPKKNEKNFTSCLHEINALGIEANTPQERGVTANSLTEGNALDCFPDFFQDPCSQDFRVIILRCFRVAVSKRLGNTLQRDTAVQQPHAVGLPGHM